MELRQFVTDDDAVSPVIGVILMVAITVILAAVIGAFVLGFGGGGPSAPSVTWDTSTANDTNDDDAVLFEHRGGDTIDDPTTLSISGDDEIDTVERWDSGNSTLDSTVTESDDLSTGDAVGVGTDSPDDGEWTLVWTADGSSQELASHSE